MEMLLVNPRRRRKGRAKSRRRSHKRRRRMSAKQRMFFGGGRRRKNPSRRRRGRSHRRRRGSRRMRNPIRLPRIGGVSSQLMGAVPGAVGALGLDVLLGLVPVPATWKTGMLGYVTKIVGALGMGMLAKMVVSQHTAAQMTNGALTVMFHGILRDFVATNVPSIPLGMYLGPTPSMAGLGYYGSGWNPDRNSTLSAYLPDISDAGGSMQMDSMETADFY